MTDGVLARSPTRRRPGATSFLVDAARAAGALPRANAARIRELGGLVLIDDDPDYLSLAPDGSFRSRTRYQDEATGEWVSETEVIESASELVELYNPAEIYAAFAEAAREQAGLPDEPTGAEDLDGAAGAGEPVERLGGSAPTRAAGRRVGGHARGRPSEPARSRGGRAPHLRPRADLPGAEPAHPRRAARAVPGRRRPPPTGSATL